MRDYFLPSQILPGLRGLLGPQWRAQVAELPEQRLVVVDANLLVRAATQAMKFRNPRATTVLEELAASGTWTLLCPSIARREVRCALRRKHVDQARLREVLGRLFASINFVRVPRAARRVDGRFLKLAKRDPKDLPYAWALEFTGADFILTADKDLSESGFPALFVGNRRVDVAQKARDHARLVADTHGRALGIQLATNAIADFTRSAYRYLGLPGTLAVAAAAFGIWHALESPTKTLVSAHARKGLAWIAEFVGPMRDRQIAAQEAHVLLASEVPKRKELSIADQIFRLVLTSELSVHEVARRIASEYGGAPTPRAVELIARSDPRLWLNLSTVTNASSVTLATSERIRRRPLRPIRTDPAAVVNLVQPSRL